ncbi:MAG: sugar nucleotide-binding protein [Paracoccaceae bacterium]
MLRLGRERTTLRVVADQIGGPTPASVIEYALISAATSTANGTPGGTHHLSGRPPQAGQTLPAASWIVQVCLAQWRIYSATTIPLRRHNRS